MDASTDLFHIFVVDDDASARMIACAELDSPELAVRDFSDAASLLAALEDSDTPVPDLILLDVEMPGMDGIEACRRLRAAGNDTVQVMFVSSHDDLETRLAAYDAGGNDYIIKPYAHDELVRKINVARQFVAQRSDLGAQAQYAQQTAFTAISSMGEMGSVLEFMRNSFACAVPADLAIRLFETLQYFRLNGLLALRCANECLHFSSRGECSQLECDILAHAATLERIFQFGNRLAINYPGVTLIVHPLPLDDPDRVGRLRDHLAILVEGAEVRLQAMEVSRQQQLQASGIGEAAVELTAALKKIEQAQAGYRVRAAEIDEAYLKALVAAFVHLGLTENQECTLADLAQRNHQQLMALQDENSNVSDDLREVARKLGHLASV